MIRANQPFGSCCDDGASWPFRSTPRSRATQEAINPRLVYLGFGLVSIAACIGVALLRTWSQYLVYFLTTAFIAGWFHSVYTGATAGYFEFFFSSRLLAAKTLVPGLILVLLSGAANWIAFSHFRRAPQAS